MTLHVFGLTGGIGSGKSAVAHCLRAHGVPVVDADQLARRAVAKGSDGLRQIVDCFGKELLDAEGELNRARLAERVFSDREAREALDAIVHPLVRMLAEREFADLARQGVTLAGYEVPLLFEVGLETKYQPVVVVSAPPELRRRWLATRNGYDAAQIEARIAAQMPLEEKVRRADYVIENDGSLELLEARSSAVLGALRDQLS